MTRNRWAVALATVSTVAVLSISAPAYAHTDLSAATPADGSTITAPITEIELKFSGLVKSKYATVVVTGPGGDTYQSGPPTALDDVVRQPVRPLRSGAYIAAYRVLAVDGHPIIGSVRFNAELPDFSGTSSAATAPAAAGPGAVAPSTTATGTGGQAPTARETATAPASTAWWLAAAGAGALVAVAGAAAWRRRRANAGRADAATARPPG